MEEKKFKSELIEKIEKFNEEISDCFKEGSKNAILVIGFDEDSDDEKDCLGAIIKGNRTSFTYGITQAMESNEAFRNVIIDAANFYRFKQNPLAAILDMVNDKIK